MPNNKKKKTLAIFSTSRSEFGLIKNLMKRLKKKKEIKILLFVGGTHLIKGYGNTINEIKKEKFKINGFFNYGTLKDDEKSITSMLGKSTIILSNLFSKFKFDSVILFGDRHDLMPIVINSIIFKKIIFHVSGGETTAGAIDNQIRNLVSKASHIHFTSAKEYSKKLITLGENKKNIYNVGSLSIDGIKNVKKISRDKIIKTFKFDKNLPIVSFTYHPSSFEGGKSLNKKLSIIFNAVSKFKFNLLISAPNLETGRSLVLKKIQSYCRKNKFWIYRSSLGFDSYQQVLMNCDFIIGNSSSGIIEAPFYKLPVINIGTRQKGRVRHKNIIDVDYNSKKIVSSINSAIDIKFKNKIKKLKYKFGNGQAGGKISKIILKEIHNNKILIKE